MKTWDEVYAHAREKCNICRCCPTCNGLACRGETPGPGGKGSGSAFVRNVEMLSKVFITMDTITSNEEVDTDYVQSELDTVVDTFTEDYETYYAE